MNYYEGRKYPFPYEREVYSQKREKLVNNSNKLEKLDCLNEAEDQLKSLTNSLKEVLNANVMKSQGEQRNLLND